MSPKGIAVYQREPFYIELNQGFRLFRSVCGGKIYRLVSNSCVGGWRRLQMVAHGD